MPFQPPQGEVILFPSPYVPDEFPPFLISNKRVLQFAPPGDFPIAEYPIEKIEHIGRVSERPTRVMGIVAFIVGVMFVFVFVYKVLPAAMYAGAPKAESATEEPGDPQSGIEGRDSLDDDPFAEEAKEKEGVSEKAGKRLKKLKEVNFGLPPLNEDVVVGLVFLLGGAIALLVGRSLYNKERHMVCLTVGGIYYPIEVADTYKQSAMLSTLQAAQQAVKR